MQVGLNSFNKTNLNKQIVQNKMSPLSFKGQDSFTPSSNNLISRDEYELRSFYIADKILNPKCEDDYNDFMELPEQIKKLNAKDPDKSKLDDLALEYISDKTHQTKAALLQQEEQMLWQEMDKPEVGIVRNYAALDRKNLLNVRENIIPTIKISAINGLLRNSKSIEHLNISYPKNKNQFSLLKKVIDTTPDNSPFASNIKTEALKLATWVCTKQEVQELSSHIINTTGIDEVKNYAISYTTASTYNEDSLLNTISNSNASIQQKRTAIKTLGIQKSKEFTKKLPELIKDPNLEQPLKVATIWAAGRCQCKENFDLLHKLVTDKDKTDPEQREMALHSLVMYVKKHKEIVKQTLNSVIAEKSDLSTLAGILLDKVNGKYHSQDKVLKSLNMSNVETAIYKKTKAQYLHTDKEMNIQSTNWIDRALAPFANALSKITAGGARAHVINDTASRILEYDIGERQFYNDPLYGGHFGDAITGVNAKPRNSGSIVMFTEYALRAKTKYNTLAHEFNHNFLHDMLDDEDNYKLKGLHKNAKEQGKCLDFYSALNEAEYFAQGYEAYANVYKPHMYIIDNANYDTGTCTVRSALKRKDPDLYNFIEYCIAKYNNN